MPAVQVKNVPSELHNRLRARARAEGMTVADYVLDALRRDLALPGPRAWAARVEAREPVEGLDVVRVLDEARREREEQLAGARRGD